jgi:hypothetical protein
MTTIVCEHGDVTFACLRCSVEELESANLLLNRELLKTQQRLAEFEIVRREAWVFFELLTMTGQMGRTELEMLTAKFPNTKIGNLAIDAILYRNRQP